MQHLESFCKEGSGVGSYSREEDYAELRHSEQHLQVRWKEDVQDVAVGKEDY